jgi:hypothetical protein
MTDIITIVPPLERCDQGGCEQRATEVVEVGDLDLIFCDRHLPSVQIRRDLSVLDTALLDELFAVAEAGQDTPLPSL